jgi:hypothetical protein
MWNLLYEGGVDIHLASGFELDTITGKGPHQRKKAIPHGRDRRCRNGK